MITVNNVVEAMSEILIADQRNKWTDVAGLYYLAEIAYLLSTNQIMKEQALELLEEANSIVGEVPDLISEVNWPYINTANELHHSIINALVKNKGVHFQEWHVEWGCISPVLSESIPTLYQSV